MSVPIEPNAMRASTAAAEPPDEPPGTSGGPSPPRRQGLIAGPLKLNMFAEPMANSSMLVFPNITAPARHRLAVTLDS